ncbi:MAG: ABC transporter permease [Micromonosporaceae bacterium]|nr:ABC transporter permease [Micromonosporaceae bacterium]
MTTLHLDEVAESTTARGFWTRSRKAGAMYLLLGAFAALVFGALAPGGEVARFTLSENSEGLAVEVPAKLGAVLLGVLCAAVGVALLTRLAAHHFGWATAVAIGAFLLSFLCWQVAGDFMPLVRTASGTLFFALPIVLGSLGGLFCERAGVINIAIEGQLLMGAFGGALIGSVAGSVWLGLVGAAFGGLLIGALLAVFAIRYLVDQIVLGVVLYVLALGLTGYLYERVMQTEQATFNNPGTFREFAIPYLSDIPVIGPVLFEANVFLYIALALVTVVYFALFHTRWGLRVRAVGEHPAAADTVGIRVQWVRYRNVMYGGMIAGIGGAFFTIGSTGGFVKGMTNGQGFIALAALIFGRWSPTGALAAAVLFGFANQLQDYLRLIDSPIDSQFLAMLPYIATIFAVAGLVGKVRPPAANGQPYVKG